MRRVLLCVPNVSEGRDLELVERLAGIVAAQDGVTLLERSADPDHHRSVYAYMGEPEDVLAATMALAREAVEHIDMARHQGSHPRIGAVDVVPFIPVLGVEMSDAIEISRRFGGFLGRLGVPVFYYEQSATRSERVALPDIRRGGYEGLRDRLRTAEWQPDEGPAGFNRESGATATGARGPLIAFNVNLSSSDVELARGIARGIRESDGGLPHVRAIGVALPSRGLVQISMNLTNPEVTPLSTALAAVADGAAGSGVEIAGTELIGVTPLAVLEDMIRYGLDAPEFSIDQVIESHLTEVKR